MLLVPSYPSKLFCAWNHFLRMVLRVEIAHSCAWSPYFLRVERHILRVVLRVILIILLRILLPILLVFLLNCFAEPINLLSEYSE